MSLSRRCGVVDPALPLSFSRRGILSSGYYERETSPDATGENHAWFHFLSVTNLPGFLNLLPREAGSSQE